MLGTKKEVKDWLVKSGIKHYTINEDLSVSVEGDGNQLTSLSGCPVSVGGDFICIHNELTSLVYGPTSVFGNFDSRDNQLVSLEGSATNVGGYFTCGDNKLTSLIV